MAYRITTHSARDAAEARLLVGLTVGVKRRAGVRWVSPGGIMHRNRAFRRESGWEGRQQMSERDGYEPGVPCWVATVHPDPEKAVGFSTELFAWEATNLMPPESPREFYICKHRGRDVAAISSERDGAPSVPAWNTYIWADS